MDLSVVVVAAGGSAEAQGFWRAGGNVARVFISHTDADRELADEVLGWLVKDGHRAFLDHDVRAGIAVGELWEQRLHERLRWADAVVCVVSAAYVASAWCSAEVG